MILNSPYISGSLTVTGNTVLSGSVTLASGTSLSGTASLATTASYAIKAVTASYSDALTVAGTLTAQTLVVQTITSSVDYVTGSTRFGSLLGNTHVFTGSVTLTGSIGIGLSSPSNLLHLVGNSSTPSLRLGSTSLSFYWDIGRENATTGDFVFNNANGGSSTEKLRITATDGNLLVSSGATIYNSSGALYMRAGTSGDLILGAGGNNGYMRISSEGNVGIGTSSPSYPLTIVSTSSAKIRIEGGSTQNGIFYGAVGSAPQYYFGNGSGLMGGDYGLVILDVDSNRPVFYDNKSTGELRLHAPTYQTMYVSGSERIRINSSGYVGIGTNNPTHLLSLYSSTQADIKFQNSGATRAYIWSNSAELAFNSLTSNPIKFFIDDVERMRIKSSGEVYVGGTSITNSPRFGVIGSGVWDGGCIGLQNNGTGGISYTIFSTNNSFGQGGSNLLFYNTTDARNNLILYSNGNYDFAGSDVSDIRLKQDIENINFGLNEIMQLSPKSYHLKSQDNLQGEHQTTLRKRYGFIAQEVQQILPDTITGTETETDYLGLDYNGMLAVAVKAIQELKAQNNDLQSQINELKAQ